MLHLKCFFFPLLLGVEIGRTEIRTLLLWSLKGGPSFVTKKECWSESGVQYIKSRFFGSQKFKDIKHLH